MRIKLGPEVYEPIEDGSYTLAYDIYMQQLLEDMGLVQLLAASTLEGADSAALGNEALKRIADSGRATELLAGFLKPVGGEWTSAWARATAADLGRLTGRHDRRLMMDMLLAGVSSFFRAGPRSSTTSH